MLCSGASLGGEILRLLIPVYANGKEIWRVMFEQVRNQAYSKVDRCHVLRGSRHCGLRAGEERELVSEVSETPILPL